MITDETDFIILQYIVFVTIKVHGNYQRRSPRGRPWPQGCPKGYILKSLTLASKPTSPRKCSDFCREELYVLVC